MVEEQVEFGLMRIKRRCVPHWLWNLFCWRNLGARQPWRWLLTCEPDEFTRRRINGRDNG